MTAVPAAQVSAVLAWAARLSADPGGRPRRDRRLPHRQSRRPGAHRRRARGRRLEPEDARAARAAAARAREAADTAALAAAAGITTLEDR